MVPFSAIFLLRFTMGVVEFPQRQNGAGTCFAIKAGAVSVPTIFDANATALSEGKDQRLHATKQKREISPSLLYGTARMIESSS